jgi:hypothetical protein
MSGVAFDNRKPPRGSVSRRFALACMTVWGCLLVVPASRTHAESTPPAPKPPPPKPPLVYTGLVPEVSESTATLRGGVNPRGMETSSYFQYGTGASYGAQTPAVAAGAGTQEIKVSQAVGGLSPNTTYHYRLVASSSAGVAIGQDRVFTTKKTPLKIVITAATPNPDPFGGPLTVTGSVSGSDAANLWVVVQGNPFPYRLKGFANMGAPRPTDEAGNFSIPLSGLAQNTQLRVAAVNPPSVTSAIVTELVAVRVGFHARRTHRRGYVRLYGSVIPAQKGARVGFQWLRNSHRAVNVGGTVVTPAGSGASRFARIVRLRHGGHYRAYVKVTDRAFTSYYSSTITIRIR